MEDQKKKRERDGSVMERDGYRGLCVCVCLCTDESHTTARCFLKFKLGSFAGSSAVHFRDRLPSSCTAGKEERPGINFLFFLAGRQRSPSLSLLFPFIFITRWWGRRILLLGERAGERGLPVCSKVDSLWNEHTKKEFEIIFKVSRERARGEFALRI